MNFIIIIINLVIIIFVIVIVVIVVIIIIINYLFNVGNKSIKIMYIVKKATFNKQANSRQQSNKPLSFFVFLKQKLN